MLLDDDDDVASLHNQGHALLLDKTSAKVFSKLAIPCQELLSIHRENCDIKGKYLKK